METYLYRASNLKSTITFPALASCGFQFLAPAKNHHFLRLFMLIIIIIKFFRRVFSEYTEAVTTSLMPIHAILPEICAFIVGFSCTVCTKMRSLRAH